jgi:hypothetical protein
MRAKGVWVRARAWGETAALPTTSTTTSHTPAYSEYRSHCVNFLFRLFVSFPPRITLRLSQDCTLIAYHFPQPSIRIPSAIHFSQPSQRFRLSLQSLRLGLGENGVPHVKLALLLYFLLSLSGLRPKKLLPCLPSTSRRRTRGTNRSPQRRRASKLLG